jgi:sulfur-oxidizing protein SoxX
VKLKTGFDAVAARRGAGRYLTGLVLLAWSAGLAAENPGDAVAQGRAIAADRNQGNCFSCHYVEGAEMTGNGGPPLLQMKLRYPDREVLRTQIADPRVRNPNTVMPPYGAHAILTEHELDLVVEFVLSL